MFIKGLVIGLYILLGFLVGLKFKSFFPKTSARILNSITWMKNKVVAGIKKVFGRK